MQQRVSREEYEEWRSSLITQELFNFFKLEGELHRRCCLDLDISKPVQALGEEYQRRILAAHWYDQLYDTQYEDIFPKEGTDEDSKGS